MLSSLNLFMQGVLVLARGDEDLMGLIPTDKPWRGKEGESGLDRVGLNEGADKGESKEEERLEVVGSELSQELKLFGSTTGKL